MHNISILLTGSAKTMTMTWCIAATGIKLSDNPSQSFQRLNIIRIRSFLPLSSLFNLLPFALPSIFPLCLFSLSHFSLFTLPINCRLLKHWRSRKAHRRPSLHYQNPRGARKRCGIVWFLLRKRGRLRDQVLSFFLLFERQIMNCTTLLSSLKLTLLTKYQMLSYAPFPWSAPSRFNYM